MEQEAAVKEHPGEYYEYEYGSTYQCELVSAHTVHWAPVGGDGDRELWTTWRPDIAPTIEWVDMCDSQSRDEEYCLLPRHHVGLHSGGAGEWSDAKAADPATIEEAANRREAHWSTEELEAQRRETERRRLEDERSATQEAADAARRADLATRLGRAAESAEPPNDIYARWERVYAELGMEHGSAATAEIKQLAHKMRSAGLTLKAIGIQLGYSP